MRKKKNNNKNNMRVLAQDNTSLHSGALLETEVQLYSDNYHYGKTSLFSTTMSTLKLAVVDFLLYNSL